MKISRRRATILRTALDVFTEKGYEAASIAELCERSGASVGSVYHHFGAKHGIAAELYLDSIRATQQATIQALLAAKNAEQGIRALPDSYLGWCELNPRRAAFLLQFRHASFMASAEPRLDELNRSFLFLLHSWAQPFVAAGELPRLEPEIYAALVIAPSEQFARLWLRGQATTDMSKARKQLATACWHGIRALRRT